NVPVKKWYQIDFSPTAFCKRVFQSVYSEPQVWLDPHSMSISLFDPSEATEMFSSPWCDTGAPESAGHGSMQEPIVDLQVQRGNQSAVASPTIIPPLQDGEAGSLQETVDMSDRSPCCPLPLIPSGVVGDGVYSCLPTTSSAAHPAVHRGPKHVQTRTRRNLLSLYEIHEEIGRGSFGVVKRATHRQSGKSFAAKFLPLRGSGQDRAFRERALLSRLSHPQVACLRDHFSTRRTLVLLTELCSNRGLLEHLLSKGSVTEREVRMYIHQVLEGLDHIHHMNILHLDIKADNIVMALLPRDEVKICDFGFAQEIDSSQDQYSEYGSPEFVAPEIVCHEPVTKATDVWSLSLGAEMPVSRSVTGYYPLTGESDRATLLRVREAWVPWDVPHVTCRSSQCLDFLKSVLQADPVVRPTATECLQHEWFQADVEDEESNKIHTKILKFIVSKSKWQCSLTCYGSILTLRPIADLLAAPPQETSVASPRSHRGCDNHSSSDSSSSEYDEVDNWATPTYKPHLSKDDDELEEVAQTKTPEIFTTRPAAGQMNQEKESVGEAKSQESTLRQEGFSRPVTPCESPEVIHLHHESLQVPSKFRQDGSHQPVSLEHGSTRQLIPRESLIKSTFHRSMESLEELSPLSARRLLLKQRSLTKKHERSRLRLGSSLSGRLDEPLLEQAEETPEADMCRSQSLSSLSKSSSFEKRERRPHSSVWRNRKSRSLDAYTQWALSVPELRGNTEQKENVSSADPCGIEGEKKSLDILSESMAEQADSRASEDCTRERGTSLSDEVMRTEALQDSDNVSDRDTLQSNITRASGLPADGEDDRFSAVRSGEEAHSVMPNEPRNREASSFRPLFVQAAPVSRMEGVSKLLTSRYGLEPFERPGSSDISFAALEKLEAEKRFLFPKIHKAQSDSRISKARYVVAVKVHSAYFYEEPCKEHEFHRHCSLTELDEAVVATEDYNGTKDVYQDPFKESNEDKASCVCIPSSQNLFTVPKMVVAPSEIDSGPVESAIEAFSSFVEDKDSSGFFSDSQNSFVESHIPDRDLEAAYGESQSSEEVQCKDPLDVPMYLDDSREPMVQGSSGEMPPYMSSKDPQGEEPPLVPYLLNWNHELTREKEIGGSSGTVKHGGSALPVNVGLLTVPPEKLCPHTSTSPVETKTGKLGLLRFFRRQSWTGQPSAPVERAVRRQASDGDTADSRQQEQILDLSITKKVKASVSSISKAVLGKQTSKEEAASSVLQTTRHVDTEGPGSLKKTSVHFPFKLPRFKRNKEPVFLQQLADQVVSLGQKVTLRCQVSGHPSPEIHWYKEARRIKTSNKVRLAAVNREHLSLTIYSAREEDLGSYRCVASSALGQAATSCTLIVSECLTSPSSPEIYPLQADGLLLVWSPVASVADLTYCVEHSSNGGGWSQLARGVIDSCYIVSNLARGAQHRFRVACLNKAGMGPFSEPSAPTVIDPERHESHVPLISMDTPWPSGGGATGQNAASFSSPQNTYTFLSEISRGRFSVVAQCQEFPTGRFFAAKITPFASEQRQWALREYQLMKRLCHAHLAQLHSALIWPHHLVLVQELCAGRELLYHLAERDLYGEMHVQDLLQQILSATHYLHCSRVVHLDLRSDNILVGKGNWVKVVDLGSAQTFCPGESFPGEKLQDLLSSQDPEVSETHEVGPEVDIWAIGVLAFIMLSAEDPYQPPLPAGREGISGGSHSRHAKVHFGRCYTSLSEGALAFLKRTLSSKSRVRPTTGECLRLPWIQGVRQPSKHQDTVVCFPTDKLRGYLRAHESSYRNHLNACDGVPERCFSDEPQDTYVECGPWTLIV
ncbi:obscurin-like, partial [Arapaima gigas]